MAFCKHSFHSINTRVLHNKDNPVRGIEAVRVGCALCGEIRLISEKGEVIIEIQGKTDGKSK